MTLSSKMIRVLGDNILEIQNVAMKLIIATPASTKGLRSELMIRDEAYQRYWLN